MFQKYPFFGVERRYFKIFFSYLDLFLFFEIKKRKKRIVGRRRRRDVYQIIGIRLVHYYLGLVY